MKPAGDEIFEVVEQSAEESALSTSETKIELSFENATPDQIEYTINNAQSVYKVYICPLPGETEVTYSGFLSGDIKEALADFAYKNKFKLDLIGSSIFLLADGFTSPIVYRFDFSTSKEELEELVRIFPQCQFSQFRDRLVVRGYFQDIKELSSLLSSGGLTPSTYVLSVILLRTRRSALRDLQAKIQFESLDLISSGYNLFDVFQAYGAIDILSSSDDLYNEQELYCTSGQKVSFSVGSEVQREERNISDQGTSTISGWRSFDDGITVEATLYDGRGSDIFADLNFESSKFNDSSDISKDRTSIQYDRLRVQAGQIYYLCQFADRRSSRSNGLVRLSRSASDDVISVWFCALPVRSKLDRPKLY